jgi:hypothetical protein
MGEGLRGALRVLAVAVLLACAACAAQKEEEKRENDLADLLAMFPGRYDNVAQAEHDEKTGTKPVHDRVALLVMPVNTPRLGHHVFYVQESAPDNKERIMSQRMFSFDTDEKRGVVGVMYNFVEPLRWREGTKDPRMYTSVMTEDVTPVGCELIWTRSGDTFTANHDKKHCHQLGRGADGPDAVLTADSLTLSGYEFKKR